MIVLKGYTVYRGDVILEKRINSGFSNIIVEGIAKLERMKKKIKLEMALSYGTNIKIAMIYLDFGNNTIEAKVIRLHYEGKTNKYIASKLALSEETVDSMVYNYLYNFKLIP